MIILRKLVKTLIFLLLISLLNANAQQIEVTWGPIIKADSRAQPDKIIGKDASGFYVLKRGRDVLFEKYDHNMNLLFSKKIFVYLTKDKKTIFEDIQMLNNKIILFTSYYDSKKNEKMLFASHVSTDGVVDPKLFQVAFFKNQISERDLYFAISLANDSSRFLIFSNLRERKKEKERFHYTIIDDNFNTFVSTYVELPYSGINVTIEDYIVDINNNIHMLYWVNLKKEEAGNRSNDEHIDGNYYLFSYYNKTKETIEYDLRVGNNVISGISMILDADNYFIYIPGYYSEKSEYALKGTFISKIDLINKQVVYNKRKDFDKEFIGLFYRNPETGKHKTKDLYNYRTRFLYVTAQGELYTVAEQYFVRVVTRTYTSSNGMTRTTTTYYYYYNHLIALKYDDKGDLVWSSKIPKLQCTINDGGYYSSVATIGYNGKLFFIYNDNPKNGTDLNGKYIMSKVIGSQTVIVSIDENGKIEKNILFKEQERAAIVRPKFTTQLSDSETLIYCVRGKQYRYGKLKLSN